MFVTCDKCKVKFELKMRKNELIVENEKVTEAYLICTKCKKTFVVTHENEKVNNLIKKISRMRKGPYPKYVIDLILNDLVHEKNRLKKLVADRDEIEKQSLEGNKKAYRIGD